MCLILEVRSYRTSRFQTSSEVKVNIGEQREFRLTSFHEYHSRCAQIQTGRRLYAGAMVLRTGSQSVLVHRTAPVMVLMVLFSCTSTRMGCAEFLKTGAPYSTMWQHRAKDDVRRVFAPAPRVVQASM